MTEKKTYSNQLQFDSSEVLVLLGGPQGGNFKTLEQELGMELHLRGNEITLVGEESILNLARGLINDLYRIAAEGKALDHKDIKRAARALKDNDAHDIKTLFSTKVVTPQAVIRPKSARQHDYLNAIEHHDLVLGVGPAGTGKTYLAMAKAVEALQNQLVKRIILTRPAVEAGEKLGFLPGSLVEKVDPYLRPLYDALHDMLDIDRTQNYIDRGLIEVAPLAFMRGRTLNQAFVILDEAQNTSTEQMYMFLTRLGFGSKVVVTGDVTQIDLPNGAISGLREALKRLESIEGIAIQRFSRKDVVRHPLVEAIIRAYEASHDK